MAHQAEHALDQAQGADAALLVGRLGPLPEWCSHPLAAREQMSEVGTLAGAGLSRATGLASVLTGLDASVDRDRRLAVEEAHQVPVEADLDVSADQVRRRRMKAAFDFDVPVRMHPACSALEDCLRASSPPTTCCATARLREPRRHPSRLPRPAPHGQEPRPPPRAPRLPGGDHPQGRLNPVFMGELGVAGSNPPVAVRSEATPRTFWARSCTAGLEGAVPRSSLTVWLLGPLRGRCRAPQAPGWIVDALSRHPATAAR